MYEYNCKLVKVVDGDTIDVDIDLGFGVWLQNHPSDFMVLTHQLEQVTR